MAVKKPGKKTKEISRDEALIEQLESMSAGVLITEEEGRIFIDKDIEFFLDSLENSPTKQYYKLILPLKFKERIQQLENEEKEISEDIKSREKKLSEDKNLEEIQNLVFKINNGVKFTDTELNDFLNKLLQIDMPKKNKEQLQQDIKQSIKNFDIVLQHLKDLEKHLVQIRNKKSVAIEDLKKNQEKISTKLQKLKEQSNKIEPKVSNDSSQKQVEKSKQDQLEILINDLNEKLNSKKATQVESFLLAHYLKNIKKDSIDNKRGEEILDDLSKNDFLPAQQALRKLSSMVEPGSEVLRLVALGANSGSISNKLVLADIAMRCQVQKLAPGETVKFTDYVPKDWGQFNPESLMQTLKQALERNNMEAINLVAKFIKDYPGLKGLIDTIINPNAPEKIKKAAQETLNILKNLFPNGSQAQAAFRLLENLNAKIVNLSKEEQTKVKKEVIKRVEAALFTHLTQQIPARENAVMQFNDTLLQMITLIGAKIRVYDNKGESQKAAPLIIVVDELKRIYNDKDMSFEIKLAEANQLMSKQGEIFSKFKHDSKLKAAINYSVNIIKFLYNKFFGKSIEQTVAPETFIPTARQSTLTKAQTFLTSFQRKRKETSSILPSFPEKIIYSNNFTLYVDSPELAKKIASELSDLNIIVENNSLVCNAVGVAVQLREKLEELPSMKDHSLAFNLNADNRDDAAILYQQASLNNLNIAIITYKNDVGELKSISNQDDMAKEFPNIKIRLR